MIHYNKLMKTMRVESGKTNTFLSKRDRYIFCGFYCFNKLSMIEQFG